MNHTRLHFATSAAWRSRALCALAFVLVFFIPPVFAQNQSVVDYPPAVKSIVEQRCMVCHGCYDAPCQLKLDDWRGFERGASKNKVYDGTRLIAANLTRLYEDAQSAADWHEKGFFSVTDPNEPHEGLLYRMLALKEEYPQPTEGLLPDDFDFRLNRDQSCPKPEEFAEYREERPYQGMPYGFPGLDTERLETLNSWLEAGAPAWEMPQTPADELDAVARWEDFLNATDKKSRLVSRYIYEHLFIASLYFEDLEQSGWYRLVRSRTPPGQPIDIIASRRPYGDPGVDTFFYRLQFRNTSALAKRHMPYALGERRMARWRELFFEPDYTVEALPGFDSKHSANPFISFKQLPLDSRYRFMLDEAHYTIMAYIKGPVCRGQVALNVIDDHFWVAFTRPNSFDPEQQAEFLAREAHAMRLPQAKDNPLSVALQWRGYARSQQKFLKAQARAIAKVVDQDSIDLDMDLIWDGGPDANENAALTVFRHFDSASVVRGHVGQQPSTMWVIDYSLLERIHYLLVAGFDVYGNAGHQLESRLYMDFLRMEGEQNFLLFLPADARKVVRNHWYRGARDRVKDYVLSPENARFERDSAIRFETDNPKSELMARFASHIPAASSRRYAVSQPQLAGLMDEQSAAFSFMPEVAFLQVLSRDGSAKIYSLIHNRAHTNIAQLFDEEDRRIPAEDTLTVVSGVLGAYPNMFFQITEAQQEQFADAVLALRSEEDYTQLVARYGVRRTAPWFWKLSDDLNAAYLEAHPIEAGLFDLNRYENR